MTNKPLHATFQAIRIGQVFTKADTYWIKSSTRTARLAENDRVFYFSKLERVTP